jgi:hypothetical protein
MRNADLKSYPRVQRSGFKGSGLKAKGSRLMDNRSGGGKARRFGGEGVIMTKLKNGGSFQYLYF